MINKSCECGGFLEFVHCDDDASGGEICYNLYACTDCGCIIKEDIIRREIVTIAPGNVVSITGYVL